MIRQWCGPPVGAASPPVKTCRAGSSAPCGAGKGQAAAADQCRHRQFEASLCGRSIAKKWTLRSTPAISKPVVSGFGRGAKRTRPKYAIFWLRSETEKGGLQPAQVAPLLGHLDIAAAAFLSLSVRGALGVVIAASALSVAADDGLIPIACTARSIAAWAAAAWSVVCADADCTI